jgi:hypothetical protein
MTFEGVVGMVTFDTGRPKGIDWVLITRQFISPSVRRDDEKSVGHFPAGAGRQQWRSTTCFALNVANNSYVQKRQVVSLVRLTP